MATLLRIDASVNPGSSLSKLLSEEFVTKWLASNVGGKVIERDLSQQMIPHLSSDMVAAMFSGEPTSTLDLSNALIEEIQSADEIVIATPMYNFGIPSNLKAYFDHIVRAGVTFRYTESGPQGLLQGKKAAVIVSSGGDYRSGPASSMNFVDGYLKTILGFIGIDQVELIHAAGTAMGDEALNQAKNEALTTIQSYLQAPSAA